MPGERATRIHTPREIWAALDRLWPQGVALDPCGSPDSLGSPAASCYPEHDDPAMRDGLARAWPLRSYCNPPYNDLRPWLDRWAECLEAVALVPARTHRGWFRDSLARSAASCWLDPVTFEGFAQSFPAPCVLLYRGGAAEAFEHASARLGGVHLGPIGRVSSSQRGLF